MKRKVYLLFILLISFTFILTACGNKESNPVNNEENLGVESNKKIEIVDMEGRKITVDKPVERVVAIGSALRMYTYINGSDLLVGIEKGQQSAETGRPYIMANPKFDKLPLVGEGHPATPDPELLIKADPDLIIAGDILDRSDIEQMEKKTGIPIVIVTTGNSTVFDKDIYESLKIIGKLTGKEDRAKDVVAYMEDCKAELVHMTKDIAEEEKPSIYLGGLSYKGIHGIESTYGNNPVLNALGAKNVVDSIGRAGSIMIDKEQLLDWDPDILVIDENGLKLVKEDYDRNPDFYNSLTAVKEGKVYGQLPYTSYYSNIETAIADAYFLGSILYPDRFKDIDPIEKADEIYSSLLGEPLYDAMAERFGGYIDVDLKE